MWSHPLSHLPKSQRASLRRELAKQHADRIAVLMELRLIDVPSKVPTKLMVPANLTMRDFLVRYRRVWNSKVGRFPPASLVVCDSASGLPLASHLTLQEVNWRHAADDGFLYVTLSEENAFG